MLYARTRRLPLVVLAVALGACGSIDPAGAPGSDAASSADVDPTDTGAPETSVEAGSATPPPPPPAGAGAGATGTTRWFVIDTVQLGLTRRGTGVNDPNAWKDYGYDLDGRATTAEESSSGAHTCARVTGAPPGILTDGNLGRDDNFGGRIMQVINQLQAGTEASLDAGIANGGQTLLLRLDDLGPGDDASVRGALYVTAPMASGAKPKFDGTDAYTVLTTSLADGTTIADAKVTFPRGYVTGGVWVSGEPAYAEVKELPLPIFGWNATPVRSPVLSVKVADGSDGTIAGAVGVAPFADALVPWAKGIGLCPSSATYQMVVQSMTQSADLSLGHPQLQDPGATCDAISLGIGFTMKPIPAPIAKAAPPPPGADPCGPGGGS